MESPAPGAGVLRVAGAAGGADRGGCWARLRPGSLRIFRPPFGTIGPGGAAALARHGLLPVYWSVVPADWDPLTPQTVLKRVLAEVHPGAVIVLHGGRPWHRGTAEAVEELVRSLREREDPDRAAGQDAARFGVHCRCPVGSGNRGGPGDA